MTFPLQLNPKPRSTALLVLLGILLGCDIGISEKFVAPSARSVQLASHPGMFWTIPGSPVLEGGTMGPQENLLYLLILCPGLAATGRGTATDYGHTANRYTSRWETATGEVTVAVTWDRRADKITIGKQTFRRDTGNVLVVVRQLSGGLVATQLPSPGSNANPATALGFIKKHMTNDALIASVQLPEQ